jgi:hypothetical protein
MTLTIVETRAITGEVDTHADTHVAAALDPVGGLLGVQEFPATAAGYARLLDWLGGFGTVGLVGIEGTGSYGSKLDIFIVLNILSRQSALCWPCLRFTQRRWFEAEFRHRPVLSTSHLGWLRDGMARLAISVLVSKDSRDPAVEARGV